MAVQQNNYGTGRRKSAVARVFLKPGKGDIIVNGAPPSIMWTPGTGTYHVNADCSGTAQILPSTGGFVNLAIVVVREGKEVRAVVAAPFDGPARTVASVGNRAE